VTVAVARPSARKIAVAYLAYFVIAGIGQALALQDPSSALAAAVQVGGTIWYAVVALLLCRLFGDPTRGAGTASGQRRTTQLPQQTAKIQSGSGASLKNLYFASPMAHPSCLTPIRIASHRLVTNLMTSSRRKDTVSRCNFGKFGRPSSGFVVYFVLTGLLCRRNLSRRKFYQPL